MMNDIELLIVCLSVYILLFIIGFVVSKYNNIIFMVRFIQLNKEISDLLKSFWTYLFEMSIFFFIITFILEKDKKNMLFLSYGIAIYVIITILVFGINAQKSLKIKQKHKTFDTDKKINFDFKIKRIHYALHIFLISYMFLFTHNYFKSNFESSKEVFIYPVTCLYILGFSFIINYIIKISPPLANKEIKTLFYILLYLCSFSIIFVFLILQWFLINKIILLDLLFFIVYSIFLALINILFLKYIRKKNQPFNFKISNNPKTLNTKDAITTSLDGTRIIICPKNKKARFLIAGLIIYFISYFALLYFLTI